MDNLKSNASSLGRQKEEWMERRTLKRDKGGHLELQLQLQNEIEEKAKIQEQLMQVTSQLSDMERYILHVVSACVPWEFSLDCPISKLKHAFNSPWEDLSNYVLTF